MSPDTPKLKIAVVDDHNLFRKGLIKLIGLVDKENKYSILFEAESGEDLQEKLTKKSLPDIVLMDIDMPDMNGYEAVGWLRKYHPNINILVVSMLETEESILRMLQLGVKGYLSKDIEVEDMHRALEAIANNGYYYSDVATGIMAHNFQSKSGNGPAKMGKLIDLTENEREFIKLACTELTYHQIADKMNLSPKTIDGYREALFHKLGVKTRVGLAMYAVKHGLVNIP